MAGQGGAAAADQQAEAVIQAGNYLLRREQPGARRCQLDRQRDAIETGADLSDRGCVGFGEVELRIRQAGALNEEPG